MRQRATLLALVLAFSSCKAFEDCKGDLSCEAQVINAYVHGYVRDAYGYQPQSFGGMGSVEATTRVQLGSIQADGSLKVVATAMVMNGQYKFDQAPAGLSNLIVQGLNASGDVTSSVILQKSPAKEGDSVAAAPMDSETSVEAEVLLNLVANGTSLDSINTVDLRARIDAQVATSVKAQADAGADVKVILQGLGEAIAAAQTTQIKAYASLGVNLTIAGWLSASVDAQVKLDAALDAGMDEKQAYGDFFTMLSASLSTMGASAEQQARAESCSSAAMRATINARLAVNSSATADAAVRGEASLEGSLSAAAVQAILKAGAAAQTVIDSSASASASLTSSLSAAADVSADLNAYASFSSSISGSGDVSGSIIGSYLGVDVTTKLTVQTVVNVSVTAGATLDSTLSTVVNTTGALDLNALGDTVVQAYSTFAATIQAQTTALVSFGAKASPAIDLLIVAQGDFRMRSGPATMMTSDLGADMAQAMMPSGDMASGGSCNTDARCGSSCAACGGGTPHCKSDGSQCVQCNAKSDCGGLTPCCVNNACAAGLC